MAFWTNYTKKVRYVYQLLITEIYNFIMCSNGPLPNHAIKKHPSRVS